MASDLVAVKKKARRARSKFNHYLDKPQLEPNQRFVALRDVLTSANEAVREASLYRREIDRESSSLSALEENEIRPLLRQTLEKFQRDSNDLPPEYLDELNDLVYQLRHPVDTLDVPQENSVAQEGANKLPGLLHSLSRDARRRPYSHRVVADLSLCGGFAAAFACSWYASKHGYPSGALFLGLGYLAGCTIIAVLGSALCALRAS